MLTEDQLNEYRRLWKLVTECLNNRDRDPDEVDSEATRLRELQYEAQMVLGCCQAAKDIQFVTWNGKRWVARLDRRATHRYFNRVLEKYRHAEFPLYEIDTPEPTHCLFCGTKLPEMEKWDPGVSVGNIEDEYECRSCGDTFACRCLPPGSDWRPKAL